MITTYVDYTQNKLSLLLIVYTAILQLFHLNLVNIMGLSKNITDIILLFLNGKSKDYHILFFNVFKKRTYIVLDFFLLQMWSIIGPLLMLLKRLTAFAWEMSWHTCPLTARISSPTRRKITVRSVVVTL